MPGSFDMSDTSVSNESFQRLSGESRKSALGVFGAP